MSVFQGHHGDIYIKEDIPSEMCKEGVDIVNGE